MVYDHEISGLLFSSSEVEELLFDGNRLKIRFGCQNEWFLRLEDLRVIQIKGVYSKGTAARFNSKEYILFFADQVQQKDCLTRWHLETNLLDAYLEEIETVEITTYPEPAWLPTTTRPEIGKGGYFPHLGL